MIMKSLVSTLQKQASEIIQRLFTKQNLGGDITQSTHPKFGHYQCNSAMKLAQSLRQKPRDIAQQIVERWEKGEMIKSLTVAGPGFINITLSREFLSKEISQVALDPRLGVPLSAKTERVVIDFSSPNVAKELHVGHLRSTIIGESLARLLEFLGHAVLRLNHIGDWGTQFGMLIAYLKEDHPEALSDSKQTNLSSLMHWYRESKKLFDNNPRFKKRAQLQVVNLQCGEKGAIDAWKKICEISRKSFQEIYDILDVKLTERGESFYNAMLPQVVADCETKGLVTISHGAKCIFLEGFKAKDLTPLPLILQKSDGGYNYDTTDLAAISHRVKKEGATRIIYVVDAGQQLHFQMDFKAAELVGYYNPKTVRLEHVPFGSVLGLDGKKFKTRSGKTVKLIDLLQEAIRQAKEMLQERLKESVSEEELNHLAHVLGINGVKYADLSSHRLKDYVFSYDRMLKFDGNTATYLLYSYVRIQGIKRNCNKDINSIVATSPIELKHETEIALGLKLRQFGETLSSMERDLLPNRLADYLYDLAEKFHLFFRDCRVNGTPEESSRIALCEVTSRILKQGLYLLGLKTTARM